MKELLSDWAEQWTLLHFGRWTMDWQIFFNYFVHCYCFVRFAHFCILTGHGRESDAVCFCSLKCQISFIWLLCSFIRRHLLMLNFSFWRFSCILRALNRWLELSNATKTSRNILNSTNDRCSKDNNPVRHNAINTTSKQNTQKNDVPFKRWVPSIWLLIKWTLLVSDAPFH